MVARLNKLDLTCLIFAKFYTNGDLGFRGKLSVVQFLRSKLK